MNRHHGQGNSYKDNTDLGLAYRFRDFLTLALCAHSAKFSVENSISGFLWFSLGLFMSRGVPDCKILGPNALHLASSLPSPQTTT